MCKYSSKAKEAMNECPVMSELNAWRKRAKELMLTIIRIGAAQEENDGAPDSNAQGSD